MSTNSTISILNKDGTVDSVYCHWDGNISHNGAILYQHYDLQKTKKLIALGRLSSLRADVDIPDSVMHSFDNPISNICIFYCRDREEDLVIQHYESLEDFENTYESQEYNYIFKELNQAWHLVEKGKLLPLRTALIKEDDISDELKAQITQEIQAKKAKKESKLLLKIGKPVARSKPRI